MKEISFKLRLLIVSALVVIACATLSTAQTREGGPGGIGAGPVVNGTARLKIESKPEPEWPKLDTDETCTIVLRAVFNSEGKVTNISFIATDPKKPKGFSDKDIKTLTKRSIEAARKIRFVPATKDGHPVSMWMQLEYNFSSKLLREKPNPDH
jgi:hypothetical protein